MRVAGVDMPAGAVARLALCLRDAGETDLSHRVGVAVDTNRYELQLDARERAAALRALETCPPSLVQLRDALAFDESGRQRTTVRRPDELERRSTVRERGRSLSAAAHRTLDDTRRLHERLSFRGSGPGGCVSC